jgi:hypothetical protein
MSQLAHADDVSESKREPAGDASAPGGWGGSEALARKAAGYADEALDAVVSVMRAPSRSAQNVLQAARMLLELAKELPPASAPAAPSSIDDLAAARERLRQARLAERQGK